MLVAAGVVESDCSPHAPLRFPADFSCKQQLGLGSNLAAGAIDSHKPTYHYRYSECTPQGESFILNGRTHPTITEILDAQTLNRCVLHPSSGS